MMLACTRTGVGTHRRGPPSRPLYYNAERDEEVALGPNRLDRTCRRKLRAGLPAAEVRALEAILRLNR